MSHVLSTAAAGELLATPSPSLTPAEVEHIARTHYGIEGTARLLTSERDQNFHLAAVDGRGFVVKVTNPAEDPLVTDFQTRALLHIAARDSGLPVPRICPTCDGEAEFVLEPPGGAPMIIRLLSYLDGIPLYRVERSAAQRRALGADLARLGLALADFRHPAAGHFLQWDIQHAAGLRPLLPHIEDEDCRRLALFFLDRFDAHVAPALPRLRRQIVHNDLNPYNVLVADDDHDRITGIFDFGDMVETALVNDVAVAAAYQLSETGDPLAGVIDFVAAYCAVCPLTAVELGLLLDLIAARMVTTVAITNWRAARYPGNRDYILRNYPAAWRGLERFAALDRDRAQARLTAACLGS